METLHTQNSETYAPKADIMNDCPLCKYPHIQIRDTIDVLQLDRAYLRQGLPSVLAEFAEVTTIRQVYCAECELSFFDPPVTGSDEYYQYWQTFPWYYLEEKDEYCFIYPMICTNDRVLDIGCGTGRFASHLNTPYYTGLELNTNALNKARHQGLNVLAEMIEDHSSEHSNYYDFVVAFQVLEHVHNPRQFLESCRDCLKPGGKLAVSVPNACSFVSASSNSVLNMPPHHISWWTPKTMSRAAAVLNMDLLSVHKEPLADIHHNWYAQTFVLNILALITHYKIRLIDYSIFYRILSRMASLGARFITPILNDPRFLPTGHSLTVVFQKRQ